MRKAVNHANHITAADAIEVAAETRTANADIIITARTDTEMIRGMTNDDTDISDTAIATMKTKEGTAKDTVADRLSATRSATKK